MGKLAGLDWAAHDFGTVSRRKRHLAVTITASGTTWLYLLVDSVGIKMLDAAGSKWGGECQLKMTVCYCGFCRTILIMCQPWIAIRMRLHWSARPAPRNRDVPTWQWYLS
ncbi:transposase [Duganella sp. LX47W]|uniref:Transposase n=1 Tax=Rugamonas apoptosis TaxID=2758570 RepID=A0A7W2INA5_9BURK|nr:transposase [Rugamonas apoptosis]